MFPQASPPVGLMLTVVYRHHTPEAMTSVSSWKSSIHPNGYNLQGASIQRHPPPCTLSLRIAPSLPLNSRLDSSLQGARDHLICSHSNIGHSPNLLPSPPCHIIMYIHRPRSAYICSILQGVPLGDTKSHSSNANPLANLYTISLLHWTPFLSASNAGTVLSQDMQASVTDCPNFSPAGPEAGISCRPSRRFDSNMTPKMIALVSAEESCFTYRVTCDINNGRCGE
jgi:hypothetical protein